MLEVRACWHYLNSAPRGARSLGASALDNGLIEILVLAFVAGFVLFRLYTTLGRRTDTERPVEPAPAPAQGELPRESVTAAPLSPQTASGAAGEGLMAIVRADQGFDVEHFVTGARAAYDLIVNAYAKGDRGALRGLLTPQVYEVLRRRASPSARRPASQGPSWCA